MNRLLLPLLLLLALFSGAVPALAQKPADAPALVVTAQNRTAAAEAGRGASRRDDRVRPKDVLRYQLSFTNPTDRPVRRVELKNPLPAEFRFVAGSARASRPDAAAAYSADGGKTFSAQPMEEVVEGGRTVRRPVPVERYTHVRWIVDGWVAPGATVTAEFDARFDGTRRGADPTPPQGTSGR